MAEVEDRGTGESVLDRCSAAFRPDAEDEPSAKRVKTDDNEEGEIEAPAPAPALPRRRQHRDCSH